MTAIVYIGGGPDRTRGEALGGPTHGPSKPTLTLNSWNKIEVISSSDIVLAKLILHVEIQKQVY